jgi:hypothetical protein
MTNSSTLQITTQAVSDTTLLGDVSTGVFRLLVPIQHREAVFQSLHSIHHPGVRATRRLITARFCWPYRVLERSTHFFLLEMGDRTNKVSTLRLKAARMPADTEPVKLPRRGRPVAQAPPDRAPPPKQRGRPRQVTFSLPPTAPPETTSNSSASSRPLRTARPPNRLNL